MEAKHISSNTELISSSQTFLLEWYLNNKRILPFREQKDPYKIWISEIMLQQTRVAAMLESYNNFTKYMPNIQSLANSKEEEVLTLWKGLGYYSRAKNLRKGAIFLMEKYKGSFPKTLGEILDIPGIGQYTGRAILSIAYDLPYAVLDGNVKRVLSRIFVYKKNILTSDAQKELQVLADVFLNHNHPGDHNQALMELGATVCTPAPNCKQCPISDFCQARKLNLESILPFNSKPQKKIEIELRFFALFNSQNEILVYKTDRRRFFKSIHSLPYIVLGDSLSENYQEKESDFYLDLIKINSTVYYYKKKHSITHHSIRLSLVSGKIENLTSLPDNSIFSKISDLESNFPSSISKKLKSLIETNLLF